MNNIDFTRNALVNNGYAIQWEGIYKQTGHRFKTQSGTSVFINEKDSYWCQGKQKLIIKKLLDDILPGKLFNKKVFVVFGRDSMAKTELEVILGHWDLTPIFLSEEISSSETIIEQLEKYMKECNYGIVLSTPDDEGFLAGCEKEKKYRMRQNVVFEIGMLFFALGRNRTALIVKCADKIEIPSDIAGVKRLQYGEYMSEIETTISKELETAGYNRR